MTAGPFVPTLDHLIARGAPQTDWHERAAACAVMHFGPRIFVRAVVEVSNFCRENCAYCGMRRDNRALARYRAHAGQLAELIVQHRPPSITDVNIQAGEDPVAVREVVLPLLRTLRRETPLGLSVCLGTLTPALYAELRETGASIYIMKFETADTSRYGALKAPGTLQERLDHIHQLAAGGWNVSSGFVAGFPGETPADSLANLELAARLPLAGCSVSPFIPGEATPLRDAPAGDIDLSLNCMAAMRLMRPDWVIPAVSALHLADRNDGYRRGLRAGANLATINLTPDDVRGDYLLYKRDRYIMTEERILSAVAAEGRTPSPESLANYFARPHHDSSSVDGRDSIGNDRAVPAARTLD